MAKTNELKDVKASIRAILNSSPQVLRANDLYRDFKNIEGSEIPFRAFRYRTLVEFLRSIPDTVEIVEPFNNNPLLKLVEDDKTLHIAKLVTCQKMNSKSSQRFRPKRATIRGRPVRNSLITYEFKKKLWNILSRHPNGLLLRHFKQHAEQLMRQYLSQQFSFDEIITEISYFAQVDRNMINLLPIARRNENFVCVMAPVDRDLSPEDERMIPSDSDLESDYYDDEESLSEKRASPKRRSLVRDLDEDDVESDSGYPHESDPLVNQTLIKNLQALFDEEENQSGIWSHELEEKYLKKFGYELALNSNGFHDVMEMVTSLTNVFTYYHYALEGSYILCDARKFKQSNGEGAGCSEIPISLLREIKTLLRNRDKKSVYADELPLIYKRLFHKTLDYHDYGFNDYDSFLRSLDQCQEIVFRNSQKRTVLSLDEQSTNETTNSNSEDASLHFPSYNPFPRDVCGIDFKLDQDPLLEKIQKRDKFNVKVAEIYTPGKFYLHFEENIEKLNRMMDRLNTFYDTNEDSYEVLPSVIARGLLCVCRYSGDSKWHRVSLMKANLIEAKAKFIDYGTVEMVKVVGLRYLHRNFAVLPALCFRAKLAGIRPKKESVETRGEKVYSKSAIQMFYDYVVETNSLEAELVEYNAQSEIYEVNLMATIDGLARSVGQALIDEKLVDTDTETFAATLKASNKKKKTTPKSMISKVSDMSTIPTEKTPTTLEDVGASASERLTPDKTPLPLPSSLPSDYPMDGQFTVPKAGPPPGLNYSSPLPRFDTPKYHPASSYTLNSSYYNPTTIQSPTINPLYGQPYAASNYVGSAIYSPSSAPFMPSQPQMFLPPYSTYSTCSYNYVQPRPTIPQAFINVRPPPGLRPVYQSPMPPGFVSPVNRFTTPYYATVSGPRTLFVPDKNFNTNETSNNMANGYVENTEVTVTNAATSSPKPKDNYEFTSNLENMNVSENSAKNEMSMTNENELQREKIREKVGVENILKQYFKTSLENASNKQEKVESTIDLIAGESKSTNGENYVTESTNSACQKYSGKVNVDMICTSHVNEDSVSQKVSSASVVTDSKTSAVDSGSSMNNSNNKKSIKLNPIKQFVLQHKKQISS